MNANLDDAQAALVLNMALRAAVEDDRDTLQAVLTGADRGVLVKVASAALVKLAASLVTKWGLAGARKVAAHAMEMSYLGAIVALPDADEPPRAG